MSGKLYGLGVGPGAPDLITLRAANILKTVDVVCIPRSSAENEPIALQIARQYIGAAAQILEIATPMTRDASVLADHWRRGAEAIAALLKEGKNVAFITLGDTMLFSTYTYLLVKVKEIFPAVAVESVPGVTSFAAAAAFLNTALAEGTDKLAIVPAVDDLAALRGILGQVPNVVLMKVAGQYEALVDLLDEFGLKDKAAYISRLGHPDQFVTFDLDSLRGRKRDYLSLILVKRGGFTC